LIARRTSPRQSEIVTALEERQPELRDQMAAPQEIAWAAAPFPDSHLLGPFAIAFGLPSSSLPK
jgi:hypothetical protein